jgi:hypothetical protein
VIQFPTDVLIGQDEELAHGLRMSFSHGLEQSLSDRAEQLVCLQVQRRLR